jgi:hypothetical protein
MSETALYIYCLVERARPPATARAPRGLAGAAAPALLQIRPSLWAVVADVPLSEYGSGRLETRLTDIAWVADVAVAHESVVEHFASATGATVVPMKLFTMFSSADRAIADLKTRSREVRRVLDRIRGCQEWGVRVTSEPITSRAPRPAPRAATGTAFLAAKKRARDDARQHARESLAAAESAYLALAGLSKAARRREAPEASTRPPLVDAAFLVAAADRARFRAAATRQARRCRASGAAMVLTGPWPAYNFVSLDGDRA